jgi:hypothetical protein
VADEGTAGRACDKCRKLLSDEDNRDLADLLEAQHPDCACQAFSIGHRSPGVVSDDETLHRIIASPRDYDPDLGIAARPFEKVFSNGLSVWRARGPDEDIQALMEESLYGKADGPKRRIFAVCAAMAADVRGGVGDKGSQLFCIYDQTVSRADEGMSPVATHAGIFLRDIPPKGTNDRKRLLKDRAGWLRELFLKGTIPAEDYRGGMCVAINARADVGEFNRG